jgi:hypothetical protein
VSFFAPLIVPLQNFSVSTNEKDNSVLRTWQTVLSLKAELISKVAFLEESVVLQVLPPGQESNTKVLNSNNNGLKSNGRCWSSWL